MLTLSLPSVTTYTEEGGFEEHEDFKIRLEHSLYAVSLWESKWKKSFFNDKEGMTPTEFLYYISCMPISDDVPDRWWTRLTQAHLLKVRDYMLDPMTAATIKRGPTKPGRKRILTSELIYFRMATFGIPFETDRWNLNRLLTLLEIASIENSPKQKMDRKTAMAQQKALCEARRAEYNSRG